MEKNYFMDKLRIFFGLRQNPPQNDFRNPIWSSDDEDDGDELYTRHEMEDFNEAIDMHEEFSRQMFDMLRSFGSMFGDVKSFLNDSPFDSLTTIHPLPPEHGDQEHFNGDNIRNYYLKPGYHNRPQEHLKEDKDLDGKITSNDISGLFKKKKDTPPLTPFNGALVPGRSFCQTIITTSVTKPDGSVETRRIVKNGNEVIEETITSTSTGTDTRMPPNTPACGVARGARVVGGEAVIPGEFPWLAALKRDGKVICGATVVARDHLITATHCVHGIEASRLSVLVGEYDVNNSRSDGFEVIHVVQHPDFNRYTYDYDIAVLRLTDPLPDNLFRPACLPDAEDLDGLEGEEAIVTGWGSTVEKGPASNIPMKSAVQIWAQEECSGAGYGRRKVTPRMLCANAPDRDACTGDSGGPLLVSQPYFTLVGIVSWGRGCARPGYPGVYARVGRFLPWLRVALRHACTCQPPAYG